MSEQPALVHLDRAEGVATIRLDRPKVNALSIALCRELAGALETLHREPPGALVITGGPRIFAAGAEISELADPARGAELAEELGRALDLVAGLPRVTIAAINGAALGGGLELALACDLRVVAENARLGQPEVLLGLFPGGGGTQRLPRLVGVARAKELIFSGREVRVDEALAIGLADAAHPPEVVLEEAEKLASSFARGPLAAIALAKQAIDRGLDGDLASGLRHERELFREALRSDDAATGIASFFASGPGHADFSGR